MLGDVARDCKDGVLIMNLCGRGDKDVFTVADALGETLKLTSVFAGLCSILAFATPALAAEPSHLVPGSLNLLRSSTVRSLPVDCMYPASITGDPL